MNGQNEQLEEIFSYYGKLNQPAGQEEVVNMLREIQELCGFISPEMKRCAAETLGVKAAMLTCLIRRFPSLKEANYQHTVTVCAGERCARKDGGALLMAVKRELVIPEKCSVSKPVLSKNGLFLLKAKNCFKQCRTAPNLMIDEKIYHQVRPEDVPELLSFAPSDR